jgi:Tfp pilus assembly protein PilV
MKMKIKTIPNIQYGIGLLEVLIALVVVSLGLLGLAKFEGSLLSASGNNKARAEAIGIAQQQIETIRYEASNTDAFEGLDDAGSPINLNPFNVMGTNAQFTVNIDIDDPDTNRIISAIVDIGWTDATGNPDSVTLMSEIALQDVQKSAYATNDSSNTTAVPSPRQSASEDVQPASQTVDPNDVISPTETPLPATGTVAADGTRLSGLAETFTVNSTDDTPVPYTLTAIADDSRYYNTYFGDGNLAVYVCDSTSTDGCRYIQNHFGGVSLSTSGIIYSAQNTDNQLTSTSPVWSSSEVTACYKGPVTQTGSGPSAVYSMPYECVYAGNCADDATKCQQGVTADEVNAKGVGPGGEFGNLGLINLDGGNGGDQVCFLEDTPDWNNTKNILNGNYDDGPSNTQNNEDYLFAGTTRSYVTRRMMSNGEERSEGINKSYRNHNFLLTNRANSPNAYKNCYNTVNSAPATYVLAPKNVVRVLGDSGTNIVGATKTFSGTMPAVTITSTYSGEDPNLYINEDGACYFDRDAGDNNFACVVPGSFIGTTIYGSNSTIPSPTADDPAVPSNYYTCSLNIDLTQANNISAATPCVWSTNFSAP